MKLTPWNVLKFWKLLMFPPWSGSALYLRLRLKGDPPWEPWLHCAVWLSVFAVIAVHHMDRIALDLLDWVWVSLGLFAPPVGFASVWILANTSGGRFRYVAMWMRLSADFALVWTILVYQAARLDDIGHGHPIMANIVLLFAAWYMATLVYRDWYLVREVENLAGRIRQEEDRHED